MTFGEKIKAARSAKSLKQSELADRLGVSNTTISNWEKNVSKPDVDTLELLCGALGIAPNHLLSLQADNEEIKKPATGEGDGLLLSEEDKKTMERFKNLSYENKLKMMGYLDSLTSQDNQ